MCCLVLEDVGKKRTTIFMPLAFVAAQIIRTLSNLCGNLNNFDFLLQFIRNEIMP
jgi:hypothetical protein